MKLIIALPTGQATKIREGKSKLTVWYYPFSLLSATDARSSFERRIPRMFIVYASLKSFGRDEANRGVTLGQIARDEAYHPDPMLQ